MSATVFAAFTTLTTADAMRPAITFYDDATGERLDLSGATLGNWVAKTANLLRDGLGLGPGDTAAVVLPPHWQSAAVVLGCWWAGLTVDLTGTHPAGVAFVTAEGSAVDADETYAMALAPLAAPFRPGPPPGTLDYVLEVRAYGDALPQAAAGPLTLALSDGTDHASLAALAHDRGVPPGTRVLVDTAAYPDLVDWLVAPMMARGSVVLCRNLDPTRVDARLGTERAVPYPGR